MIGDLVRHTRLLEIVGDMVKVRAPGAPLGGLAVVENTDGEVSSARVVELEGDVASLQVYAGGKGLSTDARVRFLGHQQQAVYSDAILGRIFGGTGEPIDGKPVLEAERKVEVGTPTVNPMMRTVPDKMIETQVPMIDVFNCLVESQKIPDLLDRR